MPKSSFLACKLTPETCTMIISKLSVTFGTRATGQFAYTLLKTSGNSVDMYYVRDTDSFAWTDFANQIMTRAKLESLFTVSWEHDHSTWFSLEKK